MLRIVFGDFFFIVMERVYGVGRCFVGALLEGDKRLARVSPEEWAGLNPISPPPPVVKEMHWQCSKCDYP